MRITFFQESLDDAAKQRAEQIRDYVKRLPVTDFDTADREAICELIEAKFSFPELPAFATGQIERDEPVFTEGSNRVSVNVYFPYRGDASLFRLYYSSRPGSPPPPTFELGEGMLMKRYEVDKQTLGEIDQRVNAEVQLVEQYAKLVRDMIPRFNQFLSATAREAFGKRAHELAQNKAATAKLSQS